MGQTWNIARWEIMRNLRNKQFLIGLLITPLIMLLFIGMPRLLEGMNQPSTATYYALDEHGGILDLSNKIFIHHSSILRAQWWERELRGCFP